jgi:hypothetical protein
LLVLVQTRSFDVRAISLPAGTLASAPSLPAALVFAVLPDGVVVVVGVLGLLVVGRGFGAAGLGAGALAAGWVLAGGFDGTSESCGEAALSALARARSRERLLSCAIELSLLRSEQAPTTRASESASGASAR